MKRVAAKNRQKQTTAMTIMICFRFATCGEIEVDVGIVEVDLGAVKE